MVDFDRAAECQNFPYFHYDYEMKLQQVQKETFTAQAESIQSLPLFFLPALAVALRKVREDERLRTDTILRAMVTICPLNGMFPYYEFYFFLLCRMLQADRQPPKRSFYIFYPSSPNPSTSRFILDAAQYYLNQKIEKNKDYMAKLEAVVLAHGTTLVIADRDNITEAYTHLQGELNSLISRKKVPDSPHQHTSAGVSSFSTKWLLASIRAFMACRSFDECRQHCRREPPLVLALCEQLAAPFFHHDPTFDLAFTDQLRHYKFFSRLQSLATRLVAAQQDAAQHVEGAEHVGGAEHIGGAEHVDDASDAESDPLMRLSTPSGGSNNGLWDLSQDGSEDASGSGHASGSADASDSDDASDKEKEEYPRANSPRANSPSADSRSADSPRADSPRADSARADSPRADSARADSARADSARADSPRADSPRADSPRANSPRANSPRANSPSADSPSADSPRADSPRAHSPRAHSPVHVAGGEASVDKMQAIGDTRPINFRTQRLRQVRLLLSKQAMPRYKSTKGRLGRKKRTTMAERTILSTSHPISEDSKIESPAAISEDILSQTNKDDAEDRATKMYQEPNDLLKPRSPGRVLSLNSSEEIQAAPPDFRKKNQNDDREWIEEKARIESYPTHSPSSHPKIDLKTLVLTCGVGMGLAVAYFSALRSRQKRPDASIRH